MKSVQIRKEEVEPPLFAEEIVLTENPKEYTEKLLELGGDLRSHSFQNTKPTVFLYTNNKQLEIKIQGKTCQI